MSAYITRAGAFLPNQPVGNNDIEAVLGTIDGRPSRVQQLILRRNGIRTRHYARDPRRGQTHTNAQMTAEAIRALGRAGNCPIPAIDVLACGTSSPDQMIPSHASMVHGLIGGPACEVVSTAGVCCAGMGAMKYAYLSVLAGAARTAVATGSELASSWLQSGAFRPQRSGACPEQDPYVSFEQEFLRWMLSDGAGAVLVEDRPDPARLTFRIDWLDMFSYAHELDPCMYCGGVKRPDGTLHTWRQLEDFSAVWEAGYLNLTQDVRLLKQHMVAVGARSLENVRRKHRLEPGNVDWWLPHLSSEFFREPVYEALAGAGFEIHPDRWFTNLRDKGNTGSASIYILLEELLASGRVRPGDRILCGIPESARFAYAYMHLTAV